MKPAELQYENIRVARAVPPAKMLGELDMRRLFEDHGELVRRAVLRLGGPGVDVEDLVQDIFVVALKRRESFAGLSKPSTWLYGIAVKVVAHARRRGRWLKLLRLEDAPDPVGRDSDSPERNFERAEAARLVYRALDRVAEKKRAVFVLYEIEKLSGEEIAAVVGCPLATVWTRLHHARKEFTHELEQLQKGGRS